MAASLVVLAAGLVWSGPAQAGWGPDFIVSANPAEGPVENSEVAALPDGGFIYVWDAQNASGAPDVLSRVVDADGTLGPINLVAAGAETPSTHDYPGYPSVAVGDEGTILVTWTRERMACSPSCNYWSIAQMVALDEEGQPIDTPQNLDATNPGTGYIGSISLSVAADGNALAAWKRYDNGSSSYTVGAATAEPGEEADTYAPLNSALNMGEPQAAAKVGGGGFLAIPFYGSGANLQGMMISASGVYTEEETMAAGPGEPVGVTAVIDSTGKGSAVFHQTVGDTGSEWLRQMSSDGAVIGAGPTRLSNDIPEAHSYAQDAAVGTDDEIVALWTQPDEPGADEAAWIRTVSASGTPGDAVQVSPGEGDVPEANLALSPDSGGLASYIRFDPESGELRLEARDLDAGFDPVGDPAVVISSDLFGGIEYIGAAIDGNDEASVIWQGQGSGAYRLFSSIFEEKGPDLDVWIQPKAVQGQEIVVGAEASDRHGVTVDWDFGDGGTATGNYVRHTFGTAGTFEVEVTATDGAGNETVETKSVEVLAKQGPAPPPPEPPIPPDTKITGKPGKKVKSKTATFKFTSSLTGSKFECRLDKAGWTDCKSPKKLKKLKPGKHTFKVRAIKGDLIDPTPASYGWKVKKSAKKTKKGGPR